MASERSEGATKGLRVINFVVPCVLKSTKQRENVAVISSSIAW